MPFFSYTMLVLNVVCPFPVFLPCAKANLGAVISGVIYFPFLVCDHEMRIQKVRILLRKKTQLNSMEIEWFPC